MRKACYLVLVFGVALLLSTTVVQAVSIDFVPSSQIVVIGNSVSVNLAISGLGNNTAPSLSTFDIDITFNPALLSFSSAVFGDPVLGDQLDLFGLGGNPTAAGITSPGTINLFELSLDLPSDLDTLQMDSFTLATITFDTLSLGTSPLSLIVNGLGDANGDPLIATLGTGSITVTNIPEPSTWLFLTTGLVGLLGYGWLRKKQTA